MSYQAVLFDFDYTLGDSTDAIMEGFRAALGDMGYPMPDREAVRRTIGHTLENAFTMVTGNSDPDRQAEFKRRCLEVAHPLMESKSTLFPGAVELLHALRAAGIAAGVVSTKHSLAIQQIIGKYGALEDLSLIVGGDQVKTPKPDPEGLNAAVAQLGLSKDQVLFCGDTTIDAKTAQAAGTDFCAVLNGTTPAGDFDGLSSVHIAPGLIELQGWLSL